MFPPGHVPVSNDAAVRSTDSDALVSRHSAARLGYFSDDYSHHFLSSQQRRSTEKRPPLINIGTHARTWAVDNLVEQFLDLHSTGDASPPRAAYPDSARCQVLSLGAGTDSRFWRFRKQWQQLRPDREWPCAKWVEVDFAAATATKARTVSSKSELKELLGGNIKIERGGLGISSPLYALVSGDLRQLPDLAAYLVSTPASAPSAPPAPLDPSKPTLLLLECVLVYLEPGVTDGLVNWFCGMFSAPGNAIVAYDPFGLDDQFGIVMRRNLALRSLSLPGADETPTLASLTERLQLAGARGSTGAMSIKQIRDEVIPMDELQRIAKIEQIDEVEELNLVLEHYAVSWANVTPSTASGRAGKSAGSLEIGLQRREAA